MQLTHLTLLGVSLTRRRVQKPQLVYICTRAECFFLGILKRWNILKSHIEKGNEGKSTKDQRKLMIKPLSDKRWSATADALRALKISQHELKDNLKT